MRPKEFAEVVNNFQEYSRQFLKIRDKGGNLVSFTFNAAQEKLDRAFEEARAQKRLLRFIVLKARQEGVSTYFAGRVFHRTTTRTQRKAVIIGHETKSANNLLEMVQRFYEKLPYPLKPQVEHSNERKLSFGNLESAINIGSADVGDTLERSATIQDILATELAFWRDAKSSLNALLQTVPDRLGTLVVIESTANGIGGEFYDRWQDAVAGRSNYIPIFLPWQDFPEYFTPFQGDAELEVFRASLTKEEEELRKAYNLSLEQLNWRRQTIANKCGHDPELFRQEYPSSPEEAFLTSGRPVFDQEQIQANLLASRNPVMRVDTAFTMKDDRGRFTAAEFVPNATGGFLTILHDVRGDLSKWDHQRFVAGCDVAEGLEQGDYSVFPILDRKYMRVCMIWHGHCHPDVLADEQHKIHLLLGGDIWFATERNNHGLTTIVQAQKLGLNQYYEGDFRKGYETSTDRIGFKTSEASKPILLNNYIVAVRDKLFECDNREVWGEHLTFVKNPRGSMSAQGKDKDPATKCFDDRVMGMALMWRCHEWLMPYKNDEPQKKFYASEEEYMREKVFKKIMDKGQTRRVKADLI